MALGLETGLKHSCGSARLTVVQGLVDTVCHLEVWKLG